MTVLSRSKKAAVRTGLPAGVAELRRNHPAGCRIGCGHSTQHRGRCVTTSRQSVQIGSSRHVPVTAIFPAIGCFLWQAVLAPLRTAVCIVSITRLMPGVHQPDPPGLIHDDLRLLPPWRGSSLFGAGFASSGYIPHCSCSCGIAVFTTDIPHGLSVCPHIPHSSTDSSPQWRVSAARPQGGVMTAARRDLGAGRRPGPAR